MRFTVLGDNKADYRLHLLPEKVVQFAQGPVDLSEGASWTVPATT